MPNIRRAVADERLAVAAFVVVLAVFAAFRAWSMDPWSRPAYDLWAYWLTRGGIEYGSTHQGDTGAFLYSPAFAQAIASLTALPWPLFAAIWTLLATAPLAWLAGRFALPVLLLPPVAMSVALGQLDLAFAAIALLGLRWPALWAVPILTKVSPGICLVWFAARREWRSLGLAALATVTVVAVSAALDPGAWQGWLALLREGEFPRLDGRLWFLPVPLGPRLAAVALLVAWGALRGRRWVLPVAMVLSLPTVWLNSPTILVAMLPLVAGAATPAGRWVRSILGPEAPAALPARPRRLGRRLPA